MHFPELYLFKTFRGHLGLVSYTIHDIDNSNCGYFQLPLAKAFFLQKRKTGYPFKVTSLIHLSEEQGFRHNLFVCINIEAMPLR